VGVAVPHEDRILRDKARRQRRVPTEPERVLWRLLRDDALGVRFRRQHPIPPFVVDFACVQARLVVEIDGWTHTDAAADAERDATLHAFGWRVLRLSNADVMENPEGVVEAIRLALRQRIPPEPPPP
jgi:very-short-patch-repair endonuclease